MEEIGRDSSTWYTMIRLLHSQRMSVRETREVLRSLIEKYGLEESKKFDPLNEVDATLTSLEQRVAQEFREQTRSLTALVCAKPPAIKNDDSIVLIILGI